MTVGSPMKILLTFALPLMAGNVFQQLYTVVDTMILGKFLGVEALAAVGSSDYVNWFTFGTVMGLAQGFAIKMAQDFGAKDYPALRKGIGNSAVLAIGLSILLAVVSFVITEPALKLLQTPDSIRGGGVLYLHVLFIGMPIYMVYNLLAGVLRSLGDAKTPLKAMITTAGINICLDFLFVMVFRWGIAGAATATVISWACGGCYCLLVLRKIDIMTFKRDDFVPGAKLCKKLMVLSMPLAFQNMVLAFGGMIVQYVVNGFGVAFIAGVVATNKLYGILEVAATSYGFAMLTYMGQNYGAGNYQRLKSGIRSGLILSTLTSLTIMFFMIVFGKVILSGFISSDSPEMVEEAMRVAYNYLVIMASALPVLYVLYAVRSSLQGMGNTMVPLISGVGEFVARCGSAIILPILFDSIALLFAEPAAWLAADLVLVPGFIIMMRRVKQELTQQESSRDAR